MSYDVIVIGLGAMGSATLYQLSQRSANVLGIDRFSPPHTRGSTHGESRVTRLAVGEGPEYIPLVRRSHEIWRELEAKTDAPILYESGCYVISPIANSQGWRKDGNFVQESAALAVQFGIPHERLSAAEVRRRHPMIQLEDPYHAYYEPSGGVVNPEAALRAQLQLARASEAEIRLNEHVLEIDFDGHGVVVHTTEGRYEADQIVVTTGAWIKPFLPASLQPSFGIYRQVMYWFEAEDVTRFGADQFPVVMWIGERQEDFFTALPVASGNQIGVKLLTEQFAKTSDPDEVNREVSEAEIEDFRHRFVLNKLRGLTTRCLDAQVCLYTMTPDAHFVIDRHPESDRILIASPCSGHGFKHSAAIGESIAQWALDGKSQIDMSKFTLSRF